MPAYTVTLRFQYPAQDEAQGIQYEIASGALNRAAACYLARKRAQRDGHLPCAYKGRYTLTAVKSD